MNDTQELSQSDNIDTELQQISLNQGVEGDNVETTNDTDTSAQPLARSTQEQNREMPHTYSVFERLLSIPLVGTAIYIYFALFIGLHVFVMIDFLIRSLHPVFGVMLWIVLMICAGFSVIALSLWRDKIRTYWD